MDFYDDAALEYNLIHIQLNIYFGKSLTFFYTEEINCRLVKFIQAEHGAKERLLSCLFK